MRSRTPKSKAQIINRLQEVIPDVERIHEVLGDDPGESLAAAVRPPSAGRGPSGEGDGDDTDGRQEAFARTGEAARSGIEKVRRDGADADLDARERDGLEAIIELYGRPAILIQDGRFMPPAHPWEKLEQHRAAIEAVLHSVGRIEVSGHPAIDWVGTGFLVADDVVMTNRHVAKEFSEKDSSMQWAFESGMTPRIDFAEELGDSRPREFELTEVIGVSDLFDMALFRATRTGQAGGLPPALALAPQPPADPGREVYVVGYPAADSRRNDPEEQRRIFANVYDVKRLQPGTVIGVMPDVSLFTHDCSTLGGNSGSCVIDLETHQILGLHFSGRYLEANKAIALAELRDDPLVKKGGLAFA